MTLAFTCSAEKLILTLFDFAILTFNLSNTKPVVYRPILVTLAGLVGLSCG